MTSTTHGWAHGTPERAVANAFGAFQDRDGPRLTTLATRDSIGAFARVFTNFGPTERDVDGQAGELTDADADSTVARAIESIPTAISARMRFAILGHVLEAPDTALVVFRILLEMPDQTLVPLPPGPHIATVKVEAGEWKLVLDQWSDIAMPGFQGVGMWVDPVDPAEPVDPQPTPEASPP